MGHITGIPRQERQYLYWDDLIGPDDPVRVIGIFVDSLDLSALGFLHVEASACGRPPYHPKVLLKIYLYGYFNRIRSSRRLEVECRRNIELRWLTEDQLPCYVTLITKCVPLVNRNSSRTKPGKGECGVRHGVPDVQPAPCH